jgi:CubicO group peptidase (beta-lactamase class C family)
MPRLVIKLITGFVFCELKLRFRIIKLTKMKKSISFIVMLSVLVVSCQLDLSGQYVYRVPEFKNDGILTGTLDEVNIDSTMIKLAINKILNDQYKEVHSILIYRDEKLVFEEYFEGHQWQWDGPAHHGDYVKWDSEMLHNIMSATKSLTSACIGIAIDKGIIDNVHQSIFDYLPDHRHLSTGGKEKITIEHLLTMTSGLEWREWSAPYSSAENPTIGIWFQDKDPITYILEKPLVDEPGAAFNYSTGNMVLLGEIIHRASNMSIDEFSEQFLFNPLSIDTAHWAVKFENGVDGNNLMITPRAMVKFGAMYLNEGVYDGQQIVPETWIDKSKTPFPVNYRINIPGEASGRMGYTYSWWTKTYYKSGKPINMYTASGFGGQHIMILPELNTVVVFTGGNYITKRPPFKILEKYIIPAVKLNK